MAMTAKGDGPGSAPAERQAEAWARGVMPAPFRLLVSVPPQDGVHRLGRLMNDRSFRLLRQEGLGSGARPPTLRINRPFVAPAGGAPVPSTRRTATPKSVDARAPSSVGAIPPPVARTEERARRMPKGEDRAKAGVRAAGRFALPPSGS